MYGFKWHAPLDPECPEVSNYMKMQDDPMMQMSGCWGEFLEDFSKSHRRKCKRCQEYGAANIEVVER